MSIKADFSCLGRKCLTDEGHTVYELPITAQRCPVCGSKRIVRLFNKIAVLTNAPPQPDMRLTSDRHFVRSTALMQHDADHADSVRPSRPGMSGNVESMRASIPGMGGEPGRGRPMSALEIQRAVREDARRGGPQSVPSVLHAVNRQPVPTVARYRDPRGD